MTQVSVAGATAGPGAVGLAWLEQQPAAQKARDVYGGTATMQAAGRRYLPQFPREEDDAYAERLGRARLYNMFRATVDGLTDMVWRKPITLGDDVPDELMPLVDNADMQGVGLNELAREGFREKHIVGHVHYFVDWYSPTDIPSSAAAEMGARPYVTMIRKEQVLRFRAENRHGRPVLVSFAYRSDSVEPSGEFGEVWVERVREYTLVEAEGAERVWYRSWTRVPAQDGTSEWAVEEPGRLLGLRMTAIPLVTDYAGRTGYMTSDPPLLDLIEETIEHYQIRSERRQSMGIAGIPILCLTGVAQEDVGTVTVGPAIGLVLPEGATAGYIETTGAALAQYREELQDIEQRATSLGLAMLQRQKRVAETAEAHRLERITEQSKLGAQANATAGALREVLRYAAMWLGLDWQPTAGTLAVNTDFDTEPLDPAMIQQLRAMVAEDAISLETFWQLLAEGEVLPATFNPEAERERLDGMVARRLARTEAMLGAAGPPT